MLEQFDYIKITDHHCDIEERVKNLFCSNEQQKRYEHICAVVKQIDDIALQYNLDREKCYISALLHDIGTLINPEEQLAYAQRNGWDLCEAEVSHPFLLHQRVSEVIAKEDFAIGEEEVLKAIAYHTSLCENATSYQMALFVADKLAWSPGGNPPYYEQMMSGLRISLEDACYAYVKYVENEGRMPCVHTDYAKAVNWLKSL